MIRIHTSSTISINSSKGSSIWETREYSAKLLEMVEEGILDKDQVILALVNYLSESDVENLMETEGWDE